MVLRLCSFIYGRRSQCIERISAAIAVLELLIAQHGRFEQAALPRLARYSHFLTQDTLQPSRAPLQTQVRLEATGPFGAKSRRYVPAIKSDKLKCSGIKQHSDGASVTIGFC